MQSLSRRALLGGLGALALSGGNARAATPRRVVSLDYALAEILVSIGAPPVAVASARDWPLWVVEPGLPEGTVDIGGGLEPNLELLVSLQPDLVLTTPYVAAVRPFVDRIAPTAEYMLYGDGGDPMPRAAAATRDLSARLGRAAEGDAFLGRVDRAFDALAARLAAASPPPVAIVALQDGRHARIYGGPGLYQNVLDRLGVRNAWTGAANYWGFGMITVERLATLPPDLHLIVIEPVPPEAEGTLARSPLWTELAFVRAGRVTRLPPSNMFGALTSALRFASQLTAALEGRP